MIKVSFLYPNAKGGLFDVRYYLEKHMPTSIEMLSVHPGFRGVSVERGLSVDAVPEPPYIAICNYLFESFDDFLAAVTPHMEELRADMRKCTDLEPVLQVSEVVISR